MKNLTIRTKLFCALGLLIFLMVIVGGSNLFSNQNISKQIKIIDIEAYPLIVASMNLQLLVERSLATQYAAASASRRDLLEDLDVIEPSLNATFQEIQVLVSDSPLVKKQFEGIMENYYEIRELGFQWVTATLNEEWEVEPQLANRFSAARKDLESAIESIKTDGINRFSLSIDLIAKLVRMTTCRTLWVCSIALICFLLSALFLSRMITRPLESLLAVIQEIRNKKTIFPNRL
jgi:hypothetical protein